jgi:hypothetical protein
MAAPSYWDGLVCAGCGKPIAPYQGVIEFHARFVVGESAELEGAVVERAWHDFDCVKLDRGA